jgi:hypothetical protein
VLLSLPSGGGWHGCHPAVTGPDEDRPALITGEALALNKFHLQILQRRVIELELPLKGAIGQAAPLAQERDHLIHDRHKVHRFPSLPGALLGCVYATPS